MKWVSDLRGIALFLICCAVLISIHEIGHAIASLFLGVTVEKIIVGIPPMISVPLYNEYIRNISFGPIILMRFTLPDAAQAKLLTPLQLILMFLAGPLVNLLIPLVGAMMHKRRKVFSSDAVYFFDFSLILFFANIAPLPYWDGGKILLNLLVMFGAISGVKEFYENTNKTILLFWQYGGFFLIFMFVDPILNFLNRFIKYDSLYQARKK